MLYRGAPHTPQLYPNLTAGCYGADEGTGHTVVQGQDLAWAFDSCHTGAGLAFGISFLNGPGTTCIHASELLEGRCRKAAGERAVLALRRSRLCPSCWPGSWVPAEDRLPALPVRGLRWARCHLPCPAAGN